MTELQVENLSYEIDGQRLLEDVTFHLGAGELVVILGANGAGKSTLLKCCLGLLGADSGSVKLAGKRVGDLEIQFRAQQISYLPQRRPMVWPILVRDVVALGRFAYGANIGRMSRVDKNAVERAIEDCDLASFVDRRMDTLSGGETARVHCARAFAAETPILLADEPTTSLDPRHQFEILQLLKSYVTAHRGALVVAHEPALAARFADRLIWMKQGKIVADGPTDTTFNAELMAEVYSVNAEVSFDHGYPSVNVLDTL